MLLRWQTTVLSFGMWLSHIPKTLWRNATTHSRLYLHLIKWALLWGKMIVDFCTRCILAYRSPNKIFTLPVLQREVFFGLILNLKRLGVNTIPVPNFSQLTREMRPDFSPTLLYSVARRNWIFIHLISLFTQTLLNFPSYLNGAQFLHLFKRYSISPPIQTVPNFPTYSNGT